MSERDYQKSTVYRWEDEVIAPRDTLPMVGFERAQALVDSVWLAEGLMYPPKVLFRVDGDTLATGSRLEIKMPEQLPTWVLMHEIAHAMTSDHEGESEKHGPKYVGVYMKLLDRFVRIPLPLLMFTAREYKVDFDLSAKPSFI